MTRQLRGSSNRNGIILANGGVLSYQHALCLSSLPPKKEKSYPCSENLGGLVSGSAPPIDLEVEGPATIEVCSHCIFTCDYAKSTDCFKTYTIEFNRNGTPLRAYIVGRLVSTNHRFLANEGNQSTLSCLSSSKEEQIGKLGTVRTGSLEESGQRRNLFVFHTACRL
jgi:hypothetical protein